VKNSRIEKYIKHRLKRREFMLSTLSAGLTLAAYPLFAQAVINGRQVQVKGNDQDLLTPVSQTGSTITVFLCGDVMTGRGIDQVLPHPGNPVLYEEYMKSASGYVTLAEEANGTIKKPVAFSYIWGDALAELERRKPDVRVINLETAVTRSDDVQDKAVNYRMNPDNIPCITAAKIDCCVLANNHVLDWGYPGFAETLKTLKQANVKIAGAGRNIQEAQKPAEMVVPGKGRVLVFSLGSETSGIPWSWAAREDRPGVNLLPDFSAKTVREIRDRIKQVRLPSDIVVASIHWGNNWGYAIPAEQQDFAHGLIDEADVDIIHGHSSHHVKGIEVYKGKLILYGCGDFLNDYEGISGHEAYRGDLTLMYFVSVEPQTGKLVRLSLVPMQVRRFRLNRTSNADASWLKNVLNREGRKFGTFATQDADNIFTLHCN
jgi:poly-gamma-glutamate capsule biosynthesis protein CapA/YwtB (metallophosphatase superfamily)